MSLTRMEFEELSKAVREKKDYEKVWIWRTLTGKLEFKIGKKEGIFVKETE